MTVMDTRCKVIRPITVDSSKLTASDLVDATTEWTAGAAFTAGQTCKVTTTANGAASATNKIYTAQGATTGDDPTTDDGTNWEETSSTNVYKMWDNVPQDRSSKAETITVTVTPGSVVNAVAFINTDATSVDVSISSAMGGGVVYSASISLIDETMIGDWYEFFFEPVRKYGDYAVFGLPTFTDAVITLTFNQPGGTVYVGACVLGQFAELGAMENGSQFGLIDYSTTTIDAAGRFTINPGNYSKRWSATIMCETRLWSGVQGVFHDLRNTPVVWVGDEDVPGSVVYGFYREFGITVDEALTSISVVVQGLTAT